jgi:Flp pilus assembly protein CpaB
LKRPGRRAIILIVGGIAVAVLGFFLITRILQQSLIPTGAPPPAPTPLTEKVLVTARGIPLGAVLAPEDLELKDIPVELAPLSRLNDKLAAVGKITNVPLVAGEVVLPHHLTDSTNAPFRNLGFTLQDDQVLLAFPIMDLMSSLNILKRGDVVDILVSITIAPANPQTLNPDEEPPEPKLYTLDAMQRITITAVVVDLVSEEQGGGNPPIAAPNQTVTPQAPSETNRAQTKPVALLLALNPQDALVLKHLKDAGAIFDLVLRSPNSTLLFETTPVDSQYLVDRYGIQIIQP